MKKIGMIGAGSWGTALATTLSDKGHNVKIWDKDEVHLNALIHDRENKKYLPGVNFGDNLNVETSIEETVDGVEMILFSVPAQYFRDAFKSVLPHIKPETIIVNVAKGIEQKSLMRLSEITFEKLPNVGYAVLSGPSHAEEVGLKLNESGRC